MRLFQFVRSHSTFRESVDAYADGELAPDRAARFEAHLASCAQCRAAVDATRVLKMSLSALPEVAVPRSFRLTPTMVAAHHHPQPPVLATSGFLVVARVAAAASVAAFAVVATLNLSSTGDSGDQTMATSDSAAPGAAELKSAASDDFLDNDNGASALTQDTSSRPEVASPPAGGGVSGAGVETPAAPATGAEPTPSGERNIPAGGDTATAPGEEPSPADAFASAYAADTDDGADYTPWLAALGALALAALGTLAFMEVQRRRT